MYAVIDTNVFVSALITKNPESPTRLVYDFIDEGEINLKHFPVTPHVITPHQVVELLKK